MRANSWPFHGLKRPSVWMKSVWTNGIAIAAFCGAATLLVSEAQAQCAPDLDPPEVLVERPVVTYALAPGAGWQRLVVADECGLSWTDQCMNPQSAIHGINQLTRLDGEPIDDGPGTYRGPGIAAEWSWFDLNLDALDIGPRDYLIRYAVIDFNDNWAFAECTIRVVEAGPALDGCDSIDNDDDGSVDEDFVAEPVTCGVGACAAGGQTACVDGQVVEQCTPGAPGVERCDGAVDDDCDGSTDEGFDAGAVCTAGVGACGRGGVMVCTADGLGTDCDAVPGAPMAELCGNGVDDDCDGETDEGFALGGACTVGQGACARDGLIACTADGTGTECQAEGGAAIEELCGNGIDDDCDGEIDEGFALGGACTSGTGACTRGGAIVCTADGRGTTCDAEPGAPAPERCDGAVDDDCDGVVDDGFDVGGACSAGLGACARAGTLVCSADGSQAECDAEPGPAAVEVCASGIDEDCDGIVDEDPDVGEPCGAAEDCAADVVAPRIRVGTPTVTLRLTDGLSLPRYEVTELCEMTWEEGCTEDWRILHGINQLTSPTGEVIDGEPGNYGNLGVLAGWTWIQFNLDRSQVGPRQYLIRYAVIDIAQNWAFADCLIDVVDGAAEICNGVDDDGDGAIDEGLADEPTSCGIGACAAAGVRTCVDGQLVDTCLPGVAAAELCGNGADDNCDGETDEGFDAGAPCSASTGACVNAGVRVCTADGTGTECNAVPPVPAPERCGNGIDDNCDGEIDEGFVVGGPCSATTGACESAGQIVCTADGTGIECNAIPPVPGLELCGTGIDEDCDGEIDEGFVVGDPCSVGAGACERQGVTACTADGLGIECAAEGGGAIEELCGNGIDDDCDGEIDEGFDVGDLCSVGVGACRATGQLVCSADGRSTQCDAQPGTPGLERCDGVEDEDCDGTTDEGFDVGAACNVGLGACARSGSRVCAADGLGTTCDVEPGAPANEICSTGVDEDCDGAIDEDPDVGQPCSAAEDCGNDVVAPRVTVGQPVVTVTLQDGPGNAVLTITEACQITWEEGCTTDVGILQGINELTSPSGEEILGEPGAYFSDGARAAWSWIDVNLDANAVGPRQYAIRYAIIDGAQNWSFAECLIDIVGANPEVCNGVDDDGNGQIDDGIANVPTTCGIGGCATAGVLTCVDGVLVDTCQVGAPSAERCGNGIDEDCDGELDDGFDVGTACSATTGACVNEGVQVCTADGLGTECDAEVPVVDVELCGTGVDEDCDGLIDEGFAGLGDPCTTGEGTCARDGVIACTPDGLGAECTIDADQAVRELCGNGADDDCDGLIDEGFDEIGGACAAGVGACARVGTLVCGADGTAVACNAAAGAPSNELCGSGVDEDCDGLVDEGFAVGDACTVGVGECARDGAVVCRPDGTDDMCDAVPGAPGDEICGNGLDDDCDGQVDPLLLCGGVEDCANDQVPPAVTVSQPIVYLELQDESTSAFLVVAEACGMTWQDGCSENQFIIHGINELTSPTGAPVYGEPGGYVSPGVRAEWTWIDVNLDRSVAGPRDYLIRYALFDQAQNWAFAECLIRVLDGPRDLCNGLDDDGDGEIDEDFVGADTACGLGPCSATGRTECVDGAIVDTCTADAPGAERCGTGVDEDCDGEIDEGFDNGDACTATDGACVGEGEMVCTADGLATECDAVVPVPSVELCGTGVDEDCDGEIDEGFALGMACTAGVGACETLGAIDCSADGLGTECNAVPKLPVDERCGDGVDDDCDGLVDEGFPVGDPCTVGMGICVVNGSLRCLSNGTGVECDARPRNPGYELCGTGRDEDCDGEIDEGFPLGEACVTGVGECQREGVRICAVNGVGTTCQADVPPAGIERCETGLDEDCDGEIDEGFDLGAACTSGLGACAVDGVLVCGGDRTQAICDGVPLPAGPELCGTGVDEDCDGATDEGFDVGQSCSVGVGACNRSGSKICSLGGLTTDCDAVPADPVAELCGNQLDDDCNGETDEGFDDNMLCSAGFGICERHGVRLCNELGTDTECSAVADAPTREEICGTAIDEDCDGEIDEGFPEGEPCIPVEACGADDVPPRMWIADPVVTLTLEPGASQIVTVTEACGITWADGCTENELLFHGINDLASPNGEDISGGPGGWSSNGVWAQWVSMDINLDEDEVGPRAYIVRYAVGDRNDNWSYVDCTVNIVEGIKDFCDGIDNDGDGEIDESFRAEPTTCGIGGCAATGMTECIDGEIIDNCTPGDPVEELCNGTIDDDCDGVLDEGFAVGQICNVGVGICWRQGLTMCAADGTSTTCSAAPLPPEEELCGTGVDEDCDGLIDEGFDPDLPCPGEEDPCNPDLIAPDVAIANPIVTLELRDVSNASDNIVVAEACGITWSDECTGAAVMVHGIAEIISATEEIRGTPGSYSSDGMQASWSWIDIDVDLNGPGEREYLLKYSVSDLTGNEVIVDCTVRIIEVVPEICDPATYVPVPTECGVGQCIAQGGTVCVNGLVEDGCVPGASMPEICGNGLDDDCDGDIDERCRTQATGLTAEFRNGQTFITWQEPLGPRSQRFRIYRHTEPITVDNIDQAVRLHEVPVDSNRFYTGRFHIGGGVWVDRYTERYVIEDLAPPLEVGTGVLVWTLGPEDFGGGSEGTGYYAVTTAGDGLENRTEIGPENTTGPVAERIEETRPVEVNFNVGSGGHLYFQYMDLRNWNATFNAPRFTVSMGLDREDPAIYDGAQYIYDYVVYEPLAQNSGCGGNVPAKSPVFLSLHGHAGGQYQPYSSNPMATACSYVVLPIDSLETWYFGHTRDHDYSPGQNPSGPNDVVVNFTEYRVLKMLYDLERDPVHGSHVDPNRRFVEGHSMGGSGTVALALRYPNLFAAANASEPMTNYLTDGDGGGIDWRSELINRWGPIGENYPIEIRGPGNWADHLQVHNGTGVWTWQNHQRTCSVRRTDEFVPLGMAHGYRDSVIEWTTQGRPVYQILDQAKITWGGYVASAQHTWLGARGLPVTLSDNDDSVPFAGLTIVRNETVPGLSNYSGHDVALPPEPLATLPFDAPPDEFPPTGKYNGRLLWSASWDAWDGAPIDTPNLWGMSFRVRADGEFTVDVTPRRRQAFVVDPGVEYVWENRRVSDNALIDTGTTTADADGLLTVPGFRILGAPTLPDATDVPGSGNRLTISRP